MEILENCRDHAYGFYADFFSSAQKPVADHLFELADKSDNNAAQRAFFDAMQQFNAKAPEIAAAFQTELDKVYSEFIAARGALSDQDNGIDTDSLSLVDRNELEDELAVSVIVSKANARNSELLWKLNRRLAVLRGGQEVTDEVNPFGPAQVFEALHKALSVLSIEGKPRLEIYKQLGKRFILNVSKLLESLNSLLVERSILPNLRFALVKTASSDAASPEVKPAQPLEQQVSSNQQQLINAIRSLQKVRGRSGLTAGGVEYGKLQTDGEGGADSFATMDYALALSAIQQSSDFRYSVSVNRPLSADQVEARFVEQMTRQGDQSGRHKMTAEDASTVDLVGMIFRYIFDDKRLADCVKALLSHLHTPFLKLALIDKSFLDNYDHSARKLLNVMAELGGKWVQDETDRLVLPKLKQGVETIVSGFIDNPAIFDELLVSFEQLKKSLSNRSEMVERRNSESEQGLERLDAAKQRASEELSQRFEKHQIPAAVANLLYQPWMDLLSFNLLRHGEDSLSWRSMMKVVDGVVASVSSSSAKDGKEAFHHRQQELDATVKEGLETIGYAPEATKILLDSLQEAQQLVYHSLIMGEAMPEVKPVAPVAPRPQPLKPGQVKRKASRNKSEKIILSGEERDILKRLRDCPFGTWFEFVDIERDGRPLALKLAWLSKVTMKCMFVDYAGVKQRSENLVEMAQWMAAGRLRFAEQVKKTFMERALEAVLKRLKKDD
jgi:hypothetical protein